MSDPIVHKEPAVQSNPFAKHLADHVNAGAVAIESERAIAEAQGKLVIAKRFPRDQARAYAAIIDACKRPGLAEEACYSFPRGGQTVSGPSIRLAEMLAANWGNIDYGIRELSRKEGVSEMEAYCWDLETNTMSSQKFTVRHIRDTRGGGVKLTEERDIYELTANMGGRRLRARVLAILPADLIQAAVDECGRTLAGGNDLPIGDRVRAMVTAFKVLGIQPSLIEKRLGHGLDTITGEELGDLRKIHNSIRDGVSKINDWFGDKPTGGDDEHMEGDPVPERPAPKARASKGVNAAKETAPAMAPEAPPPTTPPPKQTTAAEILAEADAKAAKTRQDEADAKANLNAEAQEARGRGAVDADPAAAALGRKIQSGSNATTQRALLHDGEVLVVEAQIDAFKLVTGTRSGQPWPYVTADIVSPELRGQVSMTDGAVIDGQPIPAWQLDHPVRLTVRGKKYKNGSLVNVVEKIEVLEGAAEMQSDGDV